MTYDVDEDAWLAGAAYCCPVTVYFTRAQREAMQRLADDTGRPVEEQIVEMLAKGWGPHETVVTRFSQKDWTR